MLTKVFMIYFLANSTPIVIDMDHFNLLREARMPFCEILIETMTKMTKATAPIGTCLEIPE